MNRICTLLLLCAVGLSSQEITTKLQKFEGWSTLKDEPSLRKVLVVGFTNGLFTGATYPTCADNIQAKNLLKCAVIDNLLSIEQAVALIDKYYLDHPEDWHLTLGEGILRAITVKGSPCENMAPQKGNR